MTLDVVNPFTSTPNDYTPILAGGSPLTFTFAAGYDNNGNANDPNAVTGIVGVTNPAADNDREGDPMISKNISTGSSSCPPSKTRCRRSRPTQSIQNLGGVWSRPSTSAVLTSLLASGPLGFSINDTFTGKLLLSPAELDCQPSGFDDGFAHRFRSVGGSASITVNGGDPFPPVTAVPEPASLSLVLLGIGGRRLSDADAANRRPSASRRTG